MIAEARGGRAGGRPLTFRASVSAEIAAPPERAYEVLADYRQGHPRILPRPEFQWLEVEEGGKGAGTVIRFQMRVLCRRSTFRAAVTEPEPGRVLVETDPTNGVVTTFTVVPGGRPGHARVTITTDLPRRGGALGALERAVSVRVLRRIYRRELDNLEAVASGSSDGSESG